MAIHAVLLNGVGCFQNVSLCVDRERMCKADDINKCPVCRKHHKMQGIDKERWMLKEPFIHITIS